MHLYLALLVIIMNSIVFVMVCHLSAKTIEKISIKVQIGIGLDVQL